MEGPNEVMIIMEKLNQMIIVEGHVEIVKEMKTFKKKTTLFWYNHFYGDNLFDHVVNNGYGMLLTVKHDCLAKEATS